MPIMDTLKTIATVLIIALYNLPSSYGIPETNDTAIPEGQRMKQKCLTFSAGNGRANGTSRVMKNEKPVDLRKFLSSRYESIIKIILPNSLKNIPRGAFQGGNGAYQG